MACPVSSWRERRERCRRRRSSLTATSFERCTWCAIRTSCDIWRAVPPLPHRAIGCDEEAPMRTQTTESFRHVTNEELATPSRSRGERIRTITYWTFTVLLVFELAAGSLWNLLQIEWVRVQLSHLGYPVYFAFILGVWLVGGAAVIIAPGFPRLKEWAYAGAFFHFSGAVASHLLAGDVVETWLPPLVFSMIVIVSWALRPADRRLPSAELSPETRPRAWAVPVGILVLLFLASYLTLPWVNATFRTRARDLGWIAR